MKGPAEINLHRFDINLLVVFLELWELKSVTLASEKMSLTQSAVSHALKRLRIALNDELFVSTRAGLQPTPLANELAGPIRKALDDIRAALNMGAHFDPRTAQLTFKIALSELIELAVAPALVARVAREAPGILLELDAIGANRSAHELLESGDLQLVISTRDVRGAGIQHDTLADMPVVVMAPKRLGIAGSTMPMENYLSTPHVVFRAPDNRGWMVDQTLTSMGLSRKIGAVVQNYMVMVAVAAEAGYLCHVPRLLVDQIAPGLQLVPYEAPVPIRSSHLIMSSHAAFKADPAMSWLKTQLRAVVDARSDSLSAI
jgi:DNA-binding transcriptional LysR family regulator